MRMSGAGRKLTSIAVRELKFSDLYLRSEVLRLAIDGVAEIR